MGTPESLSQLKREALIDALNRSEQRAMKRAGEWLHGYRKMSADELYDDLKNLADRHDLPVEVDGDVDVIPVGVRHVGWTLYFFPKTVPVRIERHGVLPDRSDELWSPLWNHLERLGTACEDVKPLSAKGYRLLAETDPKPSRLEETLRSFGK